MIGDFGVPIAILIMVLVDYSIEDTYTQVRWWSTRSSEEVLPGTAHWALWMFSHPQPELPNWAHTAVCTAYPQRPPCPCSSGLALPSSPTLSPTLCSAEAECAQWILSDSPRKAGLGHQPLG